MKTLAPRDREGKKQAVAEDISCGLTDKREWKAAAHWNRLVRRQGLGL